MPQNDPKLELHCPACGERLVYAHSSASGRDDGDQDNDGLYRAGADVHHYECPGPFCHRRWKFGREGGLMPDEKAGATARPVADAYWVQMAEALERLVMKMPDVDRAALESSPQATLIAYQPREGTWTERDRLTQASYRDMGTAQFGAIWDTYVERRKR